jgi:hypothetical protein
MLATLSCKEARGDGTESFCGLEAYNLMTAKTISIQLQRGVMLET